ncbi:hypothetical protein PV726_32355 [Streptomyces europaeiscabiei]|uniref:hypothetical protein n=1 Tax=Streptomyces europaeiscabiei TaxID=146819 RepID=UPI0029B09657|nr:hypothetical protein [Streptomyces europaeiscabiei]MDX3694950.1 hypothetical protein [Streptomyces europaeiscabiei]
MTEPRLPQAYDGGHRLPSAYLAAAGSRRPDAEDLAREDVERVAAHFEAAGFKLTASGWQFQCPGCQGWNFGPVEPVDRLVCIWLHGGRLPGGILGGAVCMTCEHITSPQSVDLEPRD